MAHQALAPLQMTQAKKLKHPEEKWRGNLIRRAKKYLARKPDTTQ
ncbi:hypothetical protein [Burkholderia vietnamiensis]|uniref:Transposase n=1 Tax=Burkholderia vietnamiensis TaxID=60552 RepID=A0AAW7TCK1_BURVI|nr:hypothetical protein [Burkholderia vietnamiensis]MDN7799819.1 hypothetical protein [Burkholderia vietnamiensis]MDN8036270.1 hypothetical protein [Burkholderia vietnamiensis]